MIEPKNFTVRIDNYSLCECVEGKQKESVFTDRVDAIKANQLAELLYELFGPEASVSLTYSERETR